MALRQVAMQRSQTCSNSPPSAHGGGLARTYSLRTSMTPAIQRRLLPHNLFPTSAMWPLGCRLANVGGYRQSSISLSGQQALRDATEPSPADLFDDSAKWRALSQFISLQDHSGMINLNNPGTRTQL